MCLHVLGCAREVDRGQRSECLYEVKKKRKPRFPCCPDEKGEVDLHMQIDALRLACKLSFWLNCRTWDKVGADKVCRLIDAQSQEVDKRMDEGDGRF